VFNPRHYHWYAAVLVRSRRKLMWVARGSLAKITELWYVVRVHYASEFSYQIADRLRDDSAVRACRPRIPNPSVASIRLYRLRHFARQTCKSETDVTIGSSHIRISSRYEEEFLLRRYVDLQSQAIIFMFRRSTNVICRRAPASELSNDK